MTFNHSPETRPSLILRLRNSDDVVAWREFVAVYQPLIRSLAVRKGLQQADLDDVTQEVLTRVAKHIEQWESKANRVSFRAWLATITRNQTIQFFRERDRRPSTGADSQVERMTAELNESDFDLEHNRQLFAWASRQVQARFEPKTWQAFWMTAVDGIKASDVATRLGSSVAQVYVARSRVMTELKRLVEKSEFESRLDGRVS